MDLVVAQDPIGTEQAAVGGHRQPHRPEIHATLDQGFGHRLERSPPFLQAKSIDPMIPPTGDQQITDVLVGQAVGFVGNDSRGRFAGPGHHGQGPGNLAIPTRERMKARPAVAEPVSVIASFDDVHQTTRWQAVGVVVDAEETPERVNAIGVRVPEAGGEQFELRTVGPAAIDVAALAPTGQGQLVAADQLVGGTEVLTEADVHPSPAVEGKTGQAVVWIVAGSVEVENAATAVGHQVAVVVPQGDHLLTGRHQHGVGLPRLEGCPHHHAHRVHEPVGKDDGFFRDTVRVTVPQHQQPIGGVPVVSIGWKVGVAFDDKHPPGVIDVEAGGRDDPGVGSEQFDHESRVTDGRHLLGGAQSAGFQNPGHQRQAGETHKTN